MRALFRREPEHALARWSPFAELDQLRREMDEIFNRFFELRPTRALEAFEFSPTLDVYETPDEFVMFVAAPGVAEKDLHVEITDGTVTVSGERKPLIEGENVTAHYVSRMGGHGKFSVCYTVPTPINEKKVKAVYRNGVLEIRMPKSEAAKPKVVQVQVEK
ncbi:MAG: Hsp20/alpha crystallin family protein [candidate division WOR-3 bacterium]